LAATKLTDRPPAGKPPQAIIFDIGRVIVRLNLKRAFAPLAAALTSAGARQGNTKLDPEQLWGVIQADPRWHDWQEGRMTPREWHEQVTRRFHLPVGFEAFCAAWNSALDPETILGDSIFAQLGARCRLGLISNTDPLHVEHLERCFAFMRHFPIRIYSCRVGTSKPSPAIYEQALRALDVPAAEALYVDDVPEFAEAARRVGMAAICFENAAQLGQELGRRGQKLD
jgi:FMN phosphatase YigB (HAD superfamily)